MKILVFVDVHGEIGRIKNIVEIARKEEVSALVCAGDLTFFGSNLDNLIERLDIGLPLILIPCNHELPNDIRDAARKFKFVRNLHNSVLELEGRIFIGLGGSKITPFSTPFELDDMEIDRQLRKFGRFAGKGKKAVLVVHEPPLNTMLDRIDGMHVGSKAIREFIGKHEPDFCICGHFHENAGKEEKLSRTTILNPGAEGKVIEL